MPLKNLTLGAFALLAGNALGYSHHSSHTIAHHAAPRTHLVHRGETLDKIAKWTGVSKKELIVSNNLYSKKFRPGLVLHIPAHTKILPKHYDLSTRGFAPYTLKNHDSDWKVANMFHLTPKAVRELNPRVAWNHPQPGTKIRIPLKNAFIFKLARIPVIRSRYAMTLHADTVVRNAPGSSAPRVAKVDAGRQVRVLDRDDHWYKVRFQYGTEGWVRGDLLVAEQPQIVAVHHATRHHGTEMAYHAPVRRTGRDSRSPVYAKLPTAGGDMLSFAQSMQGTPYSFGSSSRSATDCSGFTLQVLRHEGIKMPRTAAEQSGRGQHVGRGDLKEGDLVFFHTSRGSRISHVGIYMGNGKFIHASSGGGKVQVNSLSERYYKSRFATARRVAKVKHHASDSDSLAKAKQNDEQAMTKAEKQIKTTSKVTDAVGD